MSVRSLRCGTSSITSPQRRPYIFRAPASVDRGADIQIYTLMSLFIVGCAGGNASSPGVGSTSPINAASGDGSRTTRQTPAGDALTRRPYVSSSSFVPTSTIPTKRTRADAPSDPVHLKATAGKHCQGCGPDRPLVL